MKIFKLSTIAVILTVSALSAARVNSGDSQRQSLKVVVYGSNLALVEDVRSFDFADGESVVTLEDVSQQIDPVSVMVSPVDGSRSVFRVSGRKVDYDYMTADRLLKEHIGDQILFSRLDQRTGTREEVPARLLSITGGRVLEIDGRVEVDPEGTIIIPGIENLSELKPYIQLTIDSKKDFKGNLSMVYLTGGLSWNANYTLETAEGSDVASLECWVSVENGTGIDLKDCELELVSGQMNRNYSQRAPVAMMAAMKSSDEMMARGEDSFSQSNLADYHKYSLSGKVDIDNRTSNQYQLIRIDNLKIKRIYRLSAGHNYFYSRVSNPEDRLKVASIIEFTAEGLEEQPLPTGAVRVYQRGKQNGIYLLGEDNISDTPAGEKISIQTGSAFDIFAQRRQLEFKKLSDRLREVTIEIEVTNKTDRQVAVQVDETLPGDWKMIDSSTKYDQLDGSRIRFEPTIKAGAKEKITYTVQLM